MPSTLLLDPGVRADVWDQHRRPRDPGLAHAPGAPRTSEAPALAEVLRLQRSAGNAAVARRLSPTAMGAGVTLQRCGSIPPDQCPCHGADETEGAAQAPVTAQRDGADGSSSAETAPAPAASTSAGNVSPAQADRDRTLAEVKPLVDDAIASLGPAAQTVIPVPAPSTEPVAQALQRSPLSVQRDGGGAAAYHPEGGLVASVQICYDLMTGEVSLTGWIWAGAGYKTPFGWYGGYAFAEGSWPIGNLGGIVTPGVCANPSSHGAGPSASAGGGIAPFPVMITPGQRSVFSKGGIELGVLFTLHPSDGTADVEMIGLIDVKKYLGPFGAAAAAAEAAAQRIAAGLGQRVDCGAGFDLSLTAHLCRAADPATGILGYTASSLKLCGGGFIGCNINLSPEPVGPAGRRPLRSRAQPAGVRTILPNCSPSCRARRPAAASASGSTRSTVGRSPVTTSRASSRRSSSTLPMVEPITRNGLKKIRVSSADVGSAPEVVPETTTVPPGRSALIECDQVAAPTVSITASTGSGSRCPLGNAACAPSATARSPRSGEREVTQTRKPAWRASGTSAVATPPPAPCTSTVSPGCSPDAVNSIRYAVSQAVGRQAASTKSRPAGRLTRFLAGTRTSSASVPG